MGRYKSEHGIDSEEFQECMRNECGAVECSVCKVKIGEGNKGQTMNVCIGCLEYVCNDHLWRHPHCEEGR